MKKWKYILIIAAFILYIAAVIHTNINFNPSRTDYKMNEEVLLEECTVTCIDADMYPFDKYIECLSEDTRKNDDMILQVDRGTLKAPYVLEYKLKVANSSEETITGSRYGLQCCTKSWTNGIRLEYVMDRNEDVEILPGKTGIITQVVLCFPEHFSKREWERVKDGTNTFYVNLQGGLNKKYIELGSVPIRQAPEETIYAKQEDGIQKTGSEEETDTEEEYENASEWLENPSNKDLKMRVLNSFACTNLKNHPEIKPEYFMKSNIPHLYKEDEPLPAGEIPYMLKSEEPCYAEVIDYDFLYEKIPGFKEVDLYVGEEDKSNTAKRRRLLKDNVSTIKESIVYQPLFWVFETVEVLNETDNSYVLSEIWPTYILEDSNHVLQQQMEIWSYLDDSRCPNIFTYEFELSPGESVVFTMGSKAYFADLKEVSLENCYVGWVPWCYEEGEDINSVDSSAYNVVPVPIDKEVLDEFDN